jgi:uncharacterized protein
LKRYISWKQIDNYAQEIYDKLDTKIDYIYAIPRGGSVLGVMLSHLTNKNLLQTYEEAIIKIKAGHKILVIDEISDSGNTLKEIKKECITATIHIRKGTKVIPDIFCEEIINDDWIVYPWEK